MAQTTEISRSPDFEQMDRRIKILHTLRRQEQPNETPFRTWWRKGLLETDKIAKGEFGDWYSGLLAGQLEAADDVVAVARFAGKDIKAGVNQVVDEAKELSALISNDWKDAKQKIQESWELMGEEWSKGWAELKSDFIAPFKPPTPKE